MAKMTLKVKVNDLHFQYQPMSCIQGCMFGSILVILAQIKLSRRQAEFPGILSQNGQNDLEGQDQWPPFSIPPKIIPGCMFGANLVILVQIYEDLMRGQTKFTRILSQNAQNDFEGQGQWPPFSIPPESIPRCIFAANLVILVQIYDDLMRVQTKFTRILSQNAQNDFEGQGQWPPFSDNR